MAAKSPASISFPMEEEVLVVLGRFKGADLLGRRAPTLPGKDWDFFIPVDAGSDSLRVGLVGGLR